MRLAGSSDMMAEANGAYGSHVPVCFAPELLFGPPVSGQTSGPGYAWGSPPGAVRGALGVGDGAPHPFPTPVAVATDLQKIASNGWVSLFLTADGQVLASGDNRQGGLGQGSTDSLNHQTPVLVPGLTGHTISDIVVGGSQQFASCLALDSGGSLYELHSPQTELPRLHPPRS